MRKKFLVLSIPVVMISACSLLPTNRSSDGTNTSEPCIQRRAAFDVGSASTRVQIADVDVCLQQIVQTIHQSQEKVDYKEDVEKAADQQFSDAVQSSGREVFSKLIQLSRDHGVRSVNAMVGAATAAFRQAKNAEAYLSRVEQDFGLKVNIISQKDEGILGYYSAMASESQASVAAAGVAKKLVVWDIGGGSMQITGRVDNDFSVFEGDLASVSFKNRILAEVKKKKGLETPNPLSRKEIDKAIALAKSHAQRNVPVAVQKSITEAGGVVYGIGGVHGFSLGGQIKNDQYTVEDVLVTLKEKAGKTDEQIGGKYASTEITNLALVAGYMKGAGIREVRIIKTDNTSGILIHPKFWPAAQK